MATQFNPGDLVQLKSGGPLMTVKQIQSNGDLFCIWFEGAKQNNGVFAPATVKTVRSPEDE